MNFFRKNKVFVFSKNHIKESFKDYHNFTSRGAIIVANKKYKLIEWYLDESVRYVLTNEPFARDF